MHEELTAEIRELKVAANKEKQLNVDLKKAQSQLQIDDSEAKRLGKEIIRRKDEGEDEEPGFLRNLVSSFTEVLFGSEALSSQDNVIPIRAIDNQTLQLRYAKLSKSAIQLKEQVASIQNELDTLGNPSSRYEEAINRKASLLMKNDDQFRQSFEELAKASQNALDSEIILESSILAATEAIGSLSAAIYNVDNLAKAIAPAKLNHEERKNELRYVADYGRDAWEEITKAELLWQKVLHGAECLGSNLGCSFSSSDFFELPNMAEREIKSSAANHQKVQGLAARLKRVVDCIETFLPRLNEKWLLVQGERIKFETQRDELVENG